MTSGYISAELGQGFSLKGRDSTGWWRSASRK